MEISPLELAEAFERGAPVQVLDVRAKSRVAQGRIEVPATATFHNIRGSRVRQLDSLSGTGLDPEVPTPWSAATGTTAAPWRSISTAWAPRPARFAAACPPG